MTVAFVLQHLHIFEDGSDDVKLIGIYSSRQAGEAAVERLRSQPGFCDYPELVDEEGAGFYLSEYKVDKDHWSEGYVTV
jgi:hypothetical protein